MKKPAPPARKPKRAPKTVDAYRARVARPARATFEQLRRAIRSAVPADAVETLSYGIPAYRRGKVLVWFAAFSDHCSLFPTASVVARFQRELEGFALSKGTIRFSLKKRLPVRLIQKIVRARVAETEK